MTDSSFPAKLNTIRQTVVHEATRRLESDYTERDWRRLSFPLFEDEKPSLRCGAISTSWINVQPVLGALQELVMPGLLGSSERGIQAPETIEPLVDHSLQHLYELLLRYTLIEEDETTACERAAWSSLNLIARLPEFRERASWNIFASLKDPALWDRYILRHEKRLEELSRLELIPEIDAAILERTPDRYRDFLQAHDLLYAYDYQRRLVRASYPGWRSLLLHDIAHALAVGGKSFDEQVQAGPVPFIPRVISEQVATWYQCDLHPECQIGDANFFEHPHRGITTGQTGRIGIGCTIYPCTLGGVTDKVKHRHPSIGDFVLIGTDVGIYGPVQVGEHSVIGANTEINGHACLGTGVRIRAAVVVRTVITEAGRPGQIIFQDRVTVGEEALIINDLPNDLIIPEGYSIPANSHVVNRGDGAPRFL